MQNKPKTFDNFHSKSDSVALIGFTSGTTGLPKMTAHYHKDILNICEAFPNIRLQPTPNDIFTGSPPLRIYLWFGWIGFISNVFWSFYFFNRKTVTRFLLEAIQEHKITFVLQLQQLGELLLQK
jgi:2-aminobenzoate-CoA ligase